MPQANNIEQYLKILKRYNNYSDVLYRGQKNINWGIECGLTRNEGLLKNEKNIIADVMRDKQKEFSLMKRPIQYLAKMQHYGIPTRLIDFTTSPLNALYFASDDSGEKEDGVVYVFIGHTTYEYDDKVINALSMFPLIEDYNKESVCREYFERYNTNIEFEEYNEICKGNYFIRYNKIFDIGNERLRAQNGTFLICGNGHKSEIINKLDKEQSITAITIPYEYKKEIREQLSEIGIVTYNIYPELPQYAEYVRTKYSSFPKEREEIEKMYVISEISDISTWPDKKVSIIITLNDRLSKDEIKQIVYKVLGEYKIVYVIIWVYVAINQEYLIMRNWMARALWISDNAQHRPIELKEKESYNISWEFNDSYESTQKMLEDTFQDDKYLYVCNANEYMKIVKSFREIEKLFDENKFGAFVNKIIEYSKEIKNIFLILQDLGHSKNVAFDKYLENFQSLISIYDDFVILANDKDRSEIYLNRRFKKLIEDINKRIFKIDNELKVWKEKLHVSEVDMKSIKYVKSQNEYNFKPTIPINPNGLKVNFNVNIIILPKRTLFIEATTNLFDDAELLISICKESGELLAQDKVKITQGRFKTSEFSNKGIGYENGSYLVEILLPIASVQPMSFVDRAGIEYENLIGDYIDRSSISPIVKYIKKFKI